MIKTKLSARTAFRWIVVSVVISAFGCGGPAHTYDSVVTGTVTIEGELAKAGTVTFHPISDGQIAIGRIHQDGSFSLRTGQGDLSEPDGGTVMPGEYLVTISIAALPAEGGGVVSDGRPPLPGPSLIASKYATKDSTDLRLTVKPGKQVFVVDLDRAGAEPSGGESAASSKENAVVQHDSAGESEKARADAGEREPPAVRKENSETSTK